MQRGASDELSNALLSAVEHQQAADAVADREADKAYEKYEKELTRGMVADNMTFSQWVAKGHAPTYSSALENQQAKAAVVADIQGQIDGPMAALLNQARAAIRSGLNTETDLNG